MNYDISLLVGHIKIHIVGVLVFLFCFIAFDARADAICKEALVTKQISTKSILLTHKRGKNAVSKIFKPIFGVFSSREIIEGQSKREELLKTVQLWIKREIEISTLFIKKETELMKQLHTDEENKNFDEQLQKLVAQKDRFYEQNTRLAALQRVWNQINTTPDPLGKPNSHYVKNPLINKLKELNNKMIALAKEHIELVRLLDFIDIFSTEAWLYLANLGHLTEDQNTYLVNRIELVEQRVELIAEQTNVIKKLESKFGMKL